MLTVDILETEQWDEKNQMFIETKSQTIQMEHSLVSISKWESKWCKSFFSKKNKTEEESIDYYRCMTLTKNVDPNVYSCLGYDNIKKINDYIEHPMTATVISNFGKNTNRETITSELIYYWMISLQIPVEFEKWHINRLLTLIQVCTIKNNPKKMSKREIMSRNAALNAARRKKTGSKG